MTTGKALVPVKPRKVYDADRIHDNVYDRATADEILFRICHGEFLAWICRDPRMPDYPTAASWIVDDVDGFKARYDRALDLGRDYIAASILEDAELEDIGILETRTWRTGKNEGVEIKREERDRLDHRKLKIATKLKYLEKVDNRFRAQKAWLSGLNDEGNGGVETFRLDGGLPEDLGEDPTGGETP